jgi:hypothetical protein
VFFLIFICDCAINSFGLGFSAYWHPDEAGKALQLQSGIYNFYHPQLLLHLTSLANAAFHMGDSIRGIVLSGRMVSVVATAVATTAFAVLVARRFGDRFRSCNGRTDRFVAGGFHQCSLFQGGRHVADGSELDHARPAIGGR